MLNGADWLDALDAVARWTPEAAGVVAVVLSTAYRLRTGRWPWAGD